MSSDVGQNPVEEPTHANRKDFSYVGISCTNYGYTDYSRQHRNFSPVSRVPLERPAEGTPKIDYDRIQKSHSAVNSPDAEYLIVESFEQATESERENRGGADHPSVIADRIQSLFGTKTKDEFKKRSKSAGPHVRNIYGPNYRQDFLEIKDSPVDPKKEQLKPSKFVGSIKERTAFVEQLLKKDVREGVKALEELKKPPRFDIPSSKPSKEYYIQQREIQKEREHKFNLRLKEAEKRLRAIEKEEAERQRLADEEEEREREVREKAQAEEREEAQKLEEKELAEAQKVKHVEDHVQAVPEYMKVEKVQSVEQVVVNTSFGSNDSLAEEQKPIDEVDRALKNEVTTTVTKNITEDTGNGVIETKTVTVTKTSTTTKVIDSTEQVVTEEQSEKEAQITEAMAVGTEFLGKLDEAEGRIKKRIAVTETYLDERNSEDVEGMLRVAIGKGNLLIAQKCTQFRGLCHKNIQPTAAGEFPTTKEDLEGFWDMICLQIDQVLETFDKIDVLHANNWKEQGSPTRRK